ncbi:MAG TPA: hypothetical protein ENG10_02200 [Candidatus Bathyarchaeota archaeon]|nr:hypothetical protein [Candidatus Bathyarchaeota archaeon]HEX69090.1 hypothetical protein [Candidatus Bathyarchaeota archaeon]
MRIEVFDSEGNKYTISLEGNISREKAIKILDLVELLGGIPSSNPILANSSQKITKIEKVKMLIEKRFPIIWFSSREVQEAYENEFREPVSLSTISTYLSRLADRGFLMVNSNSRTKRYKMVTEITKSALRFMRGES